MTIKAILFDKDGTLINFEETFAPATALVINELAAGDEGLRQDIASVLDFELGTDTIKPNSILIAGSGGDIAEMLMPLINSTSFPSFNARLNDLYIKHTLTTLKPFDFLLPALDAFKTLELSHGVATNDSESGALSHLNGLSITERFCFVAGFDSGFGAKPEPGMVLGFADHLSLAPEEIMMVGDSSHDCDAGRAAGALAIGVTSGGAKAEGLASHADYVLPSIAELPDLIAKLNA